MVKRIIIKLRTYFCLLLKPSNVKIVGSYFKLHKIEFDIEATSNVIIELGSGVKLSNLKIYIRGINHKIELGNNVRISKGIFHMEDNDCVIKIGSKTTVESAQFACTEPYSAILVGEDCMFSNEIELRTGDSHSILEKNTHKRINFAMSISIADRVWIGAHSKILKGAEIQSDVVVGLGSIVPGGSTLKNNSIYTGIPAKCVREGIVWSRKRLLKTIEN